MIGGIHIQTLDQHRRPRLNVAEVFGSGTIGTDAAGPVSTVITHLTNGYVDRGHRVVLVDASTRRPRLLLRSGVIVKQVQPRVAWASYLPGVGPPLAAFASSWARARFVQALDREEAFDVIHVHDSIDALAIGRLCKAPVVLTAHNLNWTLEAKRRRPTLGTTLGARLDGVALATVEHVVVLNEQSKRALPNRNVSVIPNGLDLSNWPKLDRATARMRLGIPLDEFRVTYLGRIAPEKGTHTFVRAVNQTKAAIPLVADAIGSLSGKFGASDTITRYAASIVSNAPDTQFHGFIHRDSPEFRLRLAAADAVIVPSITEPFGLVVLEALACDAWVIGSDIGGIRDILNDQVGDLVPVGDVDALSRAIIARYQRGSNAAHVMNGRERASDFQWDRIVGCYIDTMNLLVNEPTH